jgi:hypothetical protein
LFSTPAVNLEKYLPATTDQCGQYLYYPRNNQTEHLPLGRIDYQASDRNLVFGRYQLGHLFQPSNYDGKNPFVTTPDFALAAHSFVLGDTYTVGAGLVSSFRGTFVRTKYVKSLSQDFFNFTDLGVQNMYYPGVYPKMAILSVTGAFSLIGGTATPGPTNSTMYQFAEDLTFVKGAHQFAFGVNHIHKNQNQSEGSTAPGSFTFTGANTNLPLADLMMGLPFSFSQSDVSARYLRENYYGAYVQDTWKANSHLTLNGGVRWEPYLPLYDPINRTAHYNQAWFDQGIHSSIFKNSPAGVLYNGDPGVPNSPLISERQWAHFAPRLGLAWDPAGNGKMTIRAAYGMLFDYPSLERWGGTRVTPPKNLLVSLTNPAGGFVSPWQGYPGGNPFPYTATANAPFLPFSVYTPIPLDLKTSYMNQWNLSIQRQIGTNWLITGNYVGNNVIHLLNMHEANPAIYLPGASCVLNGVTYTPCSSTNNTNQRRLLYLQNPSQGQYYSNIVLPDDGETRSYNALLLSAQRRAARGLTLQTNYTWSHCIQDPWIASIQNNGGYTVDRRRANRGNCDSDRRQNFNVSAVYLTPRFSSRATRLFASGWQVSGIVRILTGSYLTVASGRDNALSGTVSATANSGGTDQRPNQILASPYVPNKTAAQWLNPAAFAQPATGTYGTLGPASVQGPGSVAIDTALTRKFQIRERQSLEFRGEVFNLPNRVNLGNPDPSFTSTTFGRILTAGDPRIMQVALKFAF